jgi:hypothetical protein
MRPAGISAVSVSGPELPLTDPGEEPNLTTGTCQYRCESAYPLMLAATASLLISRSFGP